MKGHLDIKKMRFFHYFNNDKSCPFIEIGCKFRHEIAEKCVHDKSCINHLCQYRHQSVDKKDNKDTANANEIEVDDFEESNGQTNFFERNSCLVTSTPKKNSIACDNCIGKSQFEDCYLDRYVEVIGASKN